ncbi:hypothetical protein [Clostridium beijerinckii]|uniref:Uncharacterized protein n=1 Tax=Clostridium beijerinckii TaxID=1520 RepID=A0A1S9N4Y1_CLOBE|nr:hypothetical protein [Clostridium beijerinckii]MZK51088.1 hypothetical protein [Clostridium beijerinckii]MZK59290.1 hypothetical protein [Clostridium beijerinckii]MZK69409.1 hypothetical protein [Clostridium beijerinckii]MZK74782.1 hypothetical protein [Clostridium beijerinckii]MZK84500.1 hypothetical protein [Clostridium beijerinckii]
MTQLRKTISVLGISIIQDAQAMEEAAYKMGMNLVEGKDPLDNMTYEFDSTGVAIRIPYRQIIS